MGWGDENRRTRTRSVSAWDLLIVVSLAGAFVWLFMDVAVGVAG